MFLLLAWTIDNNNIIIRGTEYYLCLDLVDKAIIFQGSRSTPPWSFNLIYPLTKPNDFNHGEPNKERT